LAPRKEGTGIDLGGDYSNLETTLSKGDSVSFSTQTMDGGTHYTLTLNEINS